MVSLLRYEPLTSWRTEAYFWQGHRARDDTPALSLVLKEMHLPTATYEGSPAEPVEVLYTRFPS
jgi:hypothetical protein